MLNLDIKTIPHKKQRYPTVGDYWREKHKQHFRISEMSCKDYEFLVALHELVEAYLCEHNGVKWTDIDKFDIKFEKKRKKGNIEEPGDDPDAPYHNEHLFATYIEQLVADELGVEWADYEQEVNKL